MAAANMLAAQNMVQTLLGIDNSTKGKKNMTLRLHPPGKHK
jgi:hypothetical protein